MNYRLQLYMDEGEAPPRELARNLWAVLQSWGATDPRAAGWAYETDSGNVPVTSADDCERALEAHVYTWHFGDETRVSYEPSLFVGAADAPLVRVTHTCGIGKLNVEGIFAPSRFEAIVDERMTADDGHALLQTWMLKAIEVLRPRFGHAGSLEIPEPIAALSWDVKPPVGWLTYVSHSCGELPAKLPHPTVAYPAPDGTLLVAYPKLFQAYRSAHRQSVAILRDALVEAGMA